jgi:ribose/xylose/arabinose/galactoside ABC-type transport system permease subunit
MTPTLATDPAVAPPPAAEARPKRGGALRSVTSSKAFQGSISFLAFIAVFIGYTIWLGDKFANTDARLLDVHQNAPVLLLGLAVMMTLIAGQFDLSVGGMATLTTFLTIGLKIQQDWPFLAVIALCLVIGLIGGLINGILVVRLRVNTFIATLGTGGVFAGFSSVYGKGAQLSPTTDSKGEIPSWFSGPGSFGAFGEKFPSIILWIGLVGVAVWGFMALRRRRPASQPLRRWDAISAAIVLVVVVLGLLFGIDGWVSGVSWTIGLLLVIALVAWVLLGHTTFGRYLHATGSNAEAARLAGVNPGKETIKAFVIGGLLAATAGIFLAANQGSASPDVATGFLLPAFAAAFLSTVVLSNGRFTVWGALVGGTFLVWVSQGLIVGGLPFTWSDVVNGVVLVIAVALSTVFFRRTT